MSMPKQVKEIQRAVRAINMSKAGTLKASIEKYETTEKKCLCMDFIIRVRAGIISQCKHQEGLAMGLAEVKQ